MSEPLVSSMQGRQRDAAHGLTGTVRVTALRHPFRTERIIVELPAGGSIADLLRILGLGPRFPTRVFLDDRTIAQDEHERTYPRPGQMLVVRAIPAGGGRSKDTEILTIAVTAIAAVASWGAGAAIAAAATPAAAAGASAATTPTWALALGAFVGGAINESVKFLGGLAINAMIPPPPTPAVRLSSTPQSYTVSGTANGAAPFSPIPKIYGARRIFPQYAASPYSELVGDNQYLRMLFLPRPRRNSRFLGRAKDTHRGSPPSPGRFQRTYLGRPPIGGIEAGFECAGFRIPAVLEGCLPPRSFLGLKPIGGMSDHCRFQEPRIRLEEADRPNSKWFAKRTGGHLRRWRHTCAESQLRSGKPLLVSGQPLSPTLARIRRAPLTSTL